MTYSTTLTYEYMKAFGCLLETISGSPPSFFGFQVSHC
jgi:hypothetical protein